MIWHRETYPVRSATTCSTAVHSGLLKNVSDWFSKIWPKTGSTEGSGCLRKANASWGYEWVLVH